MERSVVVRGHNTKKRAPQLSVREPIARLCTGGRPEFPNVAGSGGGGGQSLMKVS